MWLENEIDKIGMNKRGEENLSGTPDIEKMEEKAVEGVQTVGEVVPKRKIPATTWALIGLIAVILVIVILLLADLLGGGIFKKVEQGSETPSGGEVPSEGLDSGVPAPTETSGGLPSASSGVPAPTETSGGLPPASSGVPAPTE